MKIVSEQEYESIRKEPKTFEFHLARALFPDREITEDEVVKMVSKKLPTKGKYNVILHVSNKIIDKVMDELIMASCEFSPLGKWYVFPRYETIEEVEERIRKVIPIGLVKSSEIDASLANLNKL